MEPARYWLLRQINHQLHGHVSPAVTGLREGRLVYQPDCLLSGMYVQLMLEVAGLEGIPQQCARKGCGTLFIRKHGLQRYCSELCRKRRWWHDKPKASEPKNRRESSGNGEQEG